MNSNILNICRKSRLLALGVALLTLLTIPATSQANEHQSGFSFDDFEICDESTDDTGFFDDFDLCHNSEPIGDNLFGDLEFGFLCQLPDQAGLKFYIENFDPILLEFAFEVEFDDEIIIPSDILFEWDEENPDYAEFVIDFSEEEAANFSYIFDFETLFTIDVPIGEELCNDENDDGGDNGNGDGNGDNDGDGGGDDDDNDDNNGDGEGGGDNNGGTDDPMSPCSLEIRSSTETLVVDNNEFAALAYTPEAEWTANIPGAAWIWETEFVESPTTTSSTTFRETFTLQNATSATLKIASDNSYEVYINDNDNLTYQDPAEDNFSTEDTYTDVAYHLVNGANTLEIIVTNTAGGENATAEGNPAGLLFSLELEAKSDCEVTTSPEDENDGDGDSDGGGSDGGDENDDNGGSSGATRVGGRGGDFPEPQVLGVSSNCSYLNEYMQIGDINTSWGVTKLQMFLDIVMGYDLQATGVFGVETDEAVKRFQANYQEEVMDPWVEIGLVSDNEPTGYVYKTTQWKINDLICPESVPFPDLSGESLAFNIDNNLNE